VTRRVAGTLLAALVGIGLLLLVPGVDAGAAGSQAPPSGSAASSAEVRQLAAAAPHDPAALARLRAIRTVDGRPVDLAAALEVDDPAQLDARLRALAGAAAPSGQAAGTDASEARQRAAAVLANDKYHHHDPPRPLRGVLHWIGSLFEPVLGPVGRFFDRIIAKPWRMPLLAAALAVLTALLATYFVRRRSRAAVERRHRLAGLVPEATDPRELERRADAAESAGRYGEAVRLRFLAGIVRLDRAGAVEVRRSETTGQLRDALRNPTFDELAIAFDEIVYGGRPATAADVAVARAGWSRVLDRATAPSASAASTA
jgi:hypothetical protein